MNRRFALSAVAFVVITGCGKAGQSTDAGAPSGSITILAAASLTDAFERASADLKTRYPGTDYRFSFASSSTLATQIINGAPADVFASADEPNMRKVVDLKLVSGPPSFFAGNQLQIVVTAGNPKRIAGLADLARADLIVVLAGSTVPAGRYARESLQRAGVSVHPASDEVDVRSVLNKVALGEADAGIVYVTDVRSAGAKVTGIDIPLADQVIARYPVAAIQGAQNPRLANAFIEFLVSEDGQRLLAGFGFSPP